MQFLVINSNKIKISLTGEDIKKYSFDECPEDKEIHPSRKSIVDILLLAKESVGFDSSGYRLLIQYYPTVEGGELFVTRLTGLSESKERLLRSSSNVTMISPSDKIYVFEDLEGVIKVLSIFKSLIRELECMLYYESGVGYYLILLDKLGENKEMNVLTEYAREISPSLMPYIQEHARKICENAGLLTLSEL